MASTPITLALQGGGTHGAFAWGAVDALLADERLEIRGITATSGGAMQAVVLADGLLRGGRDEARAHLQAFWKKVSIATGLLPLHMNIVDRFLSNVGIDLSPSSIALDYITKILSPYQFNLFDINPLRGIVGEMVDFEALRAQDALSLYISATHARSGKRRVFTNADITLEAVMASACLPFIFKAVEIEGEPYWDGAYSANPALSPLLDSPAPPDVILVQTIPAYVEDIPTQSADTIDRATELAFHASLEQELALVELHNRYQPNKALTLYTIEAGEVLVSLGRSSKLNAEWDFLLYLKDLGIQAAADWLAKQ